MNKAIQETHIAHGTEEFNFAVYEYFVKEGVHSWFSHWHHEYEVIYMEYGKLTFLIDGKEISLCENQAIFIDRYHIHSVDSYCNGSCHYYCFVFGESFLFPSAKQIIYQKYIYPLSTNRFTLQKHIAGVNNWEINIIKILKELTSLSIQKPYAYELGIQIRLLNIFDIMIVNKAFLSVTANEDSIRTRIKEVLIYLQQNYDSNIVISNIASSLNITTEHLIRSFKTLVGKTPKEYLIDYRISIVKNYLLTTDFSIAYIAEKCGFLDMSYFSKCFKSVTGVTPTHFRKKKDAIPFSYSQ